MRDYIERGIGDWIKGALWASALGLAIASGTALASGPYPGDLSPGNDIIGGPPVAAPSAPPPATALGTHPIGLPDGLSAADVMAHLRDRDSVGAELVATEEADVLESLLKDFRSDLVAKDLEEAPLVAKGGARPPLPSGSMPGPRRGVGEYSATPIHLPQPPRGAGEYSTPLIPLPPPRPLTPW
jgi:hypothetical protein